MGDSTGSMSQDIHKGQQIEMPPPSPKLQKDNTSQWMVWRAAAQREPKAEELRHLEQSVSTGNIVLSVELLDDANVKLTVKQTPIGDYTELYEACFRALHRLEQCTGTLTAIEGIPRPKWEMQFLLVQRFGGL